MKPFYEAHMYGQNSAYFQSKENAHNYIWQLYLKIHGGQSKEEQEKVYQSFAETDSIPNFGQIFAYIFKD